MIKVFLKNSFFYSLTNIITRGIGFIFLPLYTFFIPPEDYGFVELLNLLSILVGYIFTLEISQALARYLPASKNNKLKAYISTSLIFMVVVSAIFIVSFASLKSYFYQELFDNRVDICFYIIIAYIICHNLLVFFQSVLRWTINVKANNIISIVVAILNATVICFCIFVLNLKIYALLYAFVISHIAAILLAIYFLKENIIFYFSINILKRLLKYSVPLVFSSIGIYIALYVDRILIKEFLSLKDLGIYSIGYRFATLVSLVLAGVQASLMPLIYKKYSEPSTPNEISKIFNLFFLGVIVLILFLELFLNDIFLSVLNTEYLAAQDVVIFLMISIVFSNLYIFSPGLAIAKKTKIIALLSIMSAIINSIVNSFSIISAGIIGASVATMLVSILMSIIYIFISQKYYHINYRIFNVVFGSIILIMVYCLTNYFDIDLFYKLLIFILLLIILAIKFIGKTFYFYESR